MLRRAATSVDSSHTERPQRFNPREVAKIERALQKATPAQLRELGDAISGEDCLSESWDIAGLAKCVRWESHDEPFRHWLEERLAGAAHPAPVAFGDPSERPPRSRVAVLLIDARYTKQGQAETFPGEDVGTELRAMTRLLLRANDAGVPVFEVVSPGFFETDPRLSAMRRSSWVRVEKYENSAFPGTNLADELRERGVTDVVLMGTNTNICVLATALSAADAGLRVHISPQWTQDRHGGASSPWFLAHARVHANTDTLPLSPIPSDAPRTWREK